MTPEWWQTEHGGDSDERQETGRRIYGAELKLKTEKGPDFSRRGRRIYGEKEGGVNIKTEALRRVNRMVPRA